MSELPSQDRRCLVVAEVAQTHDGSLGLAHAFIDAVARTGADVVKFQTHIASAESTAEEPWRVKFSLQDGTRYEYWKRLEFSEEQWHGLKRHADEKKLKFVSSAFSEDAVDLLTRVGVDAWKVASGEVANSLLFERMAATKLPFWVSTGMSPISEIDTTVQMLTERGLPVTILQCTSMYPTPPDKVGLNVIPFFRERYKTGVGLSDHSGVIFPGLAAATLGIDVLEVHVTLSREMYGPDVIASLTTGELKQLVDGVRYIEAMNRAPVDKDVMANELGKMRQIFNKSVALKVNLPAGAVLRADDLTTKKPGTGINPSQLPTLVGRKLRNDVQANQLLRLDDLE
ncbi:MAG: N-acetylneuraminate synthase family protein [Anaerolineae bacterium]|nr:N-acetylneuraminate synthase family protein [Anaerolineae bacterium]